MKSLSLVLLLVCAAAANKNKLGSNVKMVRAQQVGGPGLPVDLPHPDLPGAAASQLSAVCNGGYITLTYSASITGQLVGLTVGSPAGQPSCQLGPLSLPTAVGQDVVTTADANCGRENTEVEGKKAFSWNVAIKEEETEGAVAREFSYTTTMICVADPEKPDPEQIDPQVAVAQDEGPGNFATVIPFTLTKSAASTARIWKFDLAPENPADLAGISYSIFECNAVPEGETTPSVALITEGCTKERTTTVVTVGTTNVITLLAFRFKDSPTSQVALSCTVVLCTPEGGLTECPGVSGPCAAPPPDTRIRRSSPNFLLASVIV